MPRHSDSKCSFGHDRGFYRDRENRLYVEIAFHNAAKTRFGQLKNLSNAAVSSQIGHILNHWLPLKAIDRGWLSPFDANWELETPSNIRFSRMEWKSGKRR